MLRYQSRFVSKIKSLKNSNLLILRVLHLALKQIFIVLSIFKRFIVSSDFRAIQHSKVFKRRYLHQTTTLTCINRYPEIFLEVQNYFGCDADIRILSFGCSTGEEVITLRGYFPSATIIGTDINKNCMNACRSLKLDHRVSFIDSNDHNIRTHGPYDLVFCMGVFQREPHSIIAKGITNLLQIYPFSRFNEQISKLTELINTNGLIVIYNTQYRLSDTTSFSAFSQYGNLIQSGYASPLFDKHSQIDTRENPLHVIYKRVN